MNYELGILRTREHRFEFSFRRKTELGKSASNTIQKISPVIELVIDNCVNDNVAIIHEVFLLRSTFIYYSVSLSLGLPGKISN